MAQRATGGTSLDQQTLQRGALLCLLSTLIMWAGGTLLPQSVLALMLPMALYAVGMGLVLPHAMAMALAPFGHIAGTASSLLGFIQMALSAGSAALVGQLLHDTPQPMLVAMVAITLVCLILSLRAGRSH